MGIGGSLTLIAIGAILKFAVTKHINGINVGTVGVILMIVGAHRHRHHAGRDDQPAPHRRRLPARRRHLRRANNQIDPRL